MPDPQNVAVQGPDGNQYSFPAGTTKDQAISYFKKKGVTPAGKNLDPESRAALNRLPPAGMIPSSIGPKPAWYTGAGLKELWYKAVDKGSAALPAVGGAVGGIAGGTAGGAPGAIGGALLGGGAGEASRQLVRRAALPNEEQIREQIFDRMRKAGKSEKEINEAKEWLQTHYGLPGEHDPRGIPTTSLGAAKDIAIEGGKQGAIQAATEGIGRGMGALGKSMTSKADETMSQILGVTKSNLKGTAADIEAYKKIGQIVNNEVKGGGLSLKSLAAKISETKEALVDSLNDVVKAPGSRVSNLHQIVKDGVYNVTKTLLKAGKDAEARTIAKLGKQLMGAYGEHATPAELLAFKRTLKQLNSGVSKQLRSTLNREIDSAIAKALPPSEAAKYLSTNAKISNLIRAEDAVTTKILTEAQNRQTLARKISEAADLRHPLSGIAKISEATPVRLAGVKAGQAMTKAGPFVQKFGPQGIRAIQGAIDAISSTQNNMLTQEQR